jgi:hypothetical protein
LCQPRRWHLIVVLAARNDPPYELSPIAKAVTARIHEIPRAQACGKKYENVRVSLDQTHLPRLAEADVIEYNERRKLVTPGRKFDCAVMLVRLSAVAYESLRSTVNVAELS